MPWTGKYLRSVHCSPGHALQYGQPVCGVSDIVKQNYPYDISGAYPEGGQVEAAEEMNRIASEMNLEIENYSSYETLSVTFVKDGTAFERSDLDNASMNNVAVLIFMDSHSYLNLTGQKQILRKMKSWSGTVLR